MPIDLRGFLRRYWRRLSLASAVGLVTAMIPLWSGSQHILAELYGPEIIVTVIPRDNTEKYGKPDLLYEFKFDKVNAVKHVYSEADVKTVFAAKPLLIGRFQCGGRGSAGESPSDYYELDIGIQNTGWRTAQDYLINISFSGEERPDPGVKIVYADSDALDRSYLFQEQPELKVPSCLKGKPASAPSTNGKEKSPREESVSNLSRSAYRRVGLTRDMVIMKGDLEAQMLQTINLIVKVPDDLKRFAVLYNVECANCEFFFKTLSFAQLVQPVSDSQSH